MKVTDFLDADEAAAPNRSNARNNPPNGASGPEHSRWENINHDEGPFDKLDKTATWDDIFVYGKSYTKLDRVPDSKTLVAYKRPGAESDYSVKILKDNPHVVVVHSDMCGLPTGGKQKLTMGRVCAIWYHNGDERAAATAMLQGTAGYLPPHVIQACKSAPFDPLNGLYNGPRPSADQGQQSEDHPTDDGPPADEDQEDYLEIEIVKEALKLKVRELAQARWAREKAGETALPDFIRLDDFLAQESTEEPQLIKGLWNKGTPVLFSAQFKAGKTTVRDNAIKCLVDGGRFLDRYDVTPVTDGTVVVLDLELSENMMREWLRAHGFVNQSRVVVVPMRGRAHSLNLMVPEVRARWAAQLREWNTQVLLLDCLRPALDGLGLSEDKDAGRFLNAGFDPLLVEAGGLDGMVIHHMGHTGERARGDSSMLGWGDSWRLLRKSDDPASPRYFTAYGRDIDVPESQLEYDAATRTLTITGGSRKDAEKDAAWPIVRAWIQEHQGCSAAKVVQAFNKTQTEYEPLPERVIRDAIRRALFRGELYDDQHDKGKGKAQKLVVLNLEQPEEEEP